LIDELNGIPSQSAMALQKLFLLDLIPCFHDSAQWNVGKSPHSDLQMGKKDIHLGDRGNFLQFPWDFR
jgi:hypothetical protein